MGKTYRIRTTPGDDKNINIQINQDFELLEILSLKIRQEEVYQRMCSDYGVIAGRVFANKGFGIPNAKISVFIPVSADDEENPVISAIYPYKNLEQTNEDGYKYNLLPYVPQYPNHIPTGTFPTRLDALINETVVELYDKYYKFTVTTNDSGDFLIFGVPTGEQTLVMNIDLSDIGPFSLSPQDLIRMGIATEGQFNGVNFKSSTNFNELPQIISINRTIEVVPFWGEEDVCQIGITRSDFDITSEANIDIQPVCVFMGSLMSSNEKSALRVSGVAQKETGNLCKLITGPGEIIALTQTIFRDELGLPIIERAELPNGGKLIDENGVWMFDLPMNSEYVFTNEFGEQVISDDPEIGIPTKAKYRFKFKWQQSTSLTEDYKRGYYLVPNIKEKGWGGGIDPAFIPFAAPNTYKTDVNWLQFQKSYAFSLSWSAYTTGVVSISNSDIQDIINCEDTFYEFEYNKVYTISQFMDNYKLNKNKERFIGIKRIDDDTCEDTTNRYPVNDGVFHTSLTWRIFNLVLIILSAIGLIALVIYSLIAYLWRWLKIPLFAALMYWVGVQVSSSVQGIIAASTPSPPTGNVWVAGVIRYAALIAVYLGVGFLLIKKFIELYDYDFKSLKLPMINYPDCDPCGCEEGDSVTLDGAESETQNVTPATSGIIQSFNGAAYAERLYDEDVFNNIFSNPVSDGCPSNTNQNVFNLDTDSFAIDNLLLGNEVRRRRPSRGFGVPTLQGTLQYGAGGLVDSFVFTPNLPYGERINIFNLKGNYYNLGLLSPGNNQIKVQYEPSISANQNVSHLDSIIIMITQPGFSDNFVSGSMISFVDPTLSMDPNLTGGTINTAGTFSITGTSVYPTQVTIKYADPNSKVGNFSKNYTLSTYTGETNDLYLYNSDIEYYQVVTGMTVTNFVGLSSSSPRSNSFADILLSKTRIVRGKKLLVNNNCYSCTNNVDSAWGISFKDIRNIDLYDNLSEVVILQRGVDPYSPKYETKVDLGVLFGYSNHNQVSITTKLKLNVPIRNIDTTIGGQVGNQMMYIHSQAINNATVNNGQYLFFPSYFFQPDSFLYSAFTTNAHRYYSLLDSQNLNWRLEPTDPDSNISNWVSPQPNVNNGKDLFPKFVSGHYFVINPNTPQNYSTTESITGGALMTVRYPWYDSNCRVNLTSLTFRYDGPPHDYYFSRIYPKTISVQMTNSNRIVMRSDRLPSSSSLKNFAVNTAYTETYDNTPLLQQNPNLSVTSYDSGTIFSIGGGLPTYSYNEGSFLSGTNQFYGNVLNTFSCKGMVELDCYTGNGLTFGVNPDCPNNDAVENGCYVFVKRPLLGLFKPKGNNDITNWAEYSMRFRFFYGLCQGVLSTVFNNNWINGNLYAFPFKINTYYNRLNQVSFRQYPRQLLVLQEETNNFYYRSSPYNNGRFIGYVTSESNKDGANVSNIKYPTTIMNMGPKNDVLKYLIMNANYYGYIMNKMPQTSYNDLSELINFFSIIRIINQNFWKNLLTSELLRNLFTRKGNKVDGDFAQSSAINSQLGIIPFDSDFYETGGPNPNVFAAGFGSNSIMMGIFFETNQDDIQTRDFVSPGRIIRFNQNTQSFVYDYIPRKSQIVPHYRWDIDNGNTIFGSQINEWATSPNLLGSFFQERYQSLDRISSPYPKAGDLTNDYNMRGYLYAVDAPIILTTAPLVIGEIYTIVDYYPGDNFTNVGAPSNAAGVSFQATGTNPQVWLNSKLETIPLYKPFTNPNPNPALGGAPWYFYFGVKKGQTAMNKFYTKYIGEVNLNE